MNVFRSGLGAKLALVLAFPLGGISPAAAVPLDAPACEQLQTQLDTLRNEGAAADMARGPEWARANLPLARLQRIETLLEVEEQLNFRCGLAKSRITLPTTIEGGEEEIPAPGEATVEGSAGGVALPQRAPAAQKRPAAAAATVTVPKAPAPKAPVAKAPATKPAAAKEAEKKAAPPQKASVKAAKPSVEATEPKKAPAKKKQQPKADDAYRPAPRPPQASESGGAALAPRQ
jgi:hypothetical protein